MTLNLVRRSTKGSPLTAADHDGNLDKLEVAIEASPSGAREWTAETISQAEAEAGTGTTRRAFTAQRVFQAVAAWWAGSTSKTKLDGIEAGAQVNVATDLSYTASSRLLASSTGADATLPLVSSTAAGLAPASGGGTTNFLRADGTWAAPAGGGGGAVVHPGYQTFANGSLVAPFNCSAILAAQAVTAQRVYYHPIYIPVAQTFTQILCRTNTTYAGTSDIYLGVYDHDASINRPNSKIFDSGLFQITASGQANYGPGAISLTLQPGFYWLAFLAATAGTTPSFMGPPGTGRGIGFPWFTEITTGGAIATVLFQNSQLTLPANASPTAPSAGVASAVTLLGV